MTRIEYVGFWMSRTDVQPPVKRVDTPMTLFTVCLAYFLTQLGFAPVTVVLPTLAAAFGADQSQAA